MNIQRIKDAISAKTACQIVVLNMVRQFEDKEKTKPAPWLDHWENDARIRVVMHEEVFNRIKANPLMEGLALKQETVQPEDMNKAPYERFIIITPLHIEGTF